MEQNKRNPLHAVRDFFEALNCPKKSQEGPIDDKISKAFNLPHENLSFREKGI